MTHPCILYDFISSKIKYAHQILISPSFHSNLAGTIIGGVILAFLFFLLREKAFKIPHITGRWYIKMTTEKTSYNPYQNMVLHYTAILWREGFKIKGTIEKIYEYSSTTEQEYIGKYRTRGKVEGYIEKNYLGKDRLFIHITENGHERESTHFYELICNHSDNMCGKFVSMIADQEGKVIWQRKAL